MPGCMEGCSSFDSYGWINSGTRVQDFFLFENVFFSLWWTLRSSISWLNGEEMFAFVKKEIGKTASKVSVSFRVPIRNSWDLLLIPVFDSATWLFLGVMQTNVHSPQVVGHWWQTRTNNWIAVAFRSVDKGILTGLQITQRQRPPGLLLIFP